MDPQKGPLRICSSSSNNSSEELFCTSPSSFMFLRSIDSPFLFPSSFHNKPPPNPVLLPQPTLQLVILQKYPCHVISSVLFRFLRASGLPQSPSLRKSWSFNKIQFFMVICFIHTLLFGHLMNIHGLPGLPLSTEVTTSLP